MSAKDFEKLRKHFAQQLRKEKFSKTIDNNYIGIKSGEFVATQWFQREEGKWRLVINNITENNFPENTEIQEASQGEIKSRTVTLRVRERPWYKKVDQKNDCDEEKAWTSVYSDKTSNLPAITAALAICNEKDRSCCSLGK